MAKATWNKVLDDLQRLAQQEARNAPSPGQPSAADKYRREKIAAIEQVTGRPLVVYASACTSPGKPVPAEMLMLDFSDKVGFKTVAEGILGPDLDILVHSPGGYAEAAESVVQQLRREYSNIRFIVPSFAKSAATILVMSGNEILMDPDAELGPVDPQMRTPNGASPAEAILEQFKKAQDELKQDSTKLPSWMPILAPLGPSLLVDCQNAIDLSKTLVRTWTEQFMFAGDSQAPRKAQAISQFLGDHSNFKSHARAVKLPDLQRLEVKVIDLQTTGSLYQAVAELYCCLDILLGNSPVYKIFDSSSGNALIRQLNVIPQMMQVPPPSMRPPQAPRP